MYEPYPAPYIGIGFSVLPLPPFDGSSFTKFALTGGRGPPMAGIMKTLCRYRVHLLGDMDCVSIQIFEEFDGLVSERSLGRAAQVTLDHERVDRSLSLVIADDATVQDLNKRYRGLDETTDVLSFAFDSQGHYYGKDSPPTDWTEEVEFVLPASEGNGLGEVIISFPQAVRQAADAGRDVNDELVQLVTHGILHLLGHDHMEQDEQRVMAAREKAILAGSMGAASE